MKTTNKLIFTGIFLMGLVLVLVIPATIQAQYNGCTYHSYRACNGTYLYWYDSCGNQQDIAQTCLNGCNNNSCAFTSCTYHAYKLCVGNNIYWYSSCGAQQDLYSSCTGGQICQYGQCAAYVQPIQLQNNYVAHYKTACDKNSMYWYDSLGVLNDLYKNCDDSNGCTIDACSGDKCLNTLKCDNSTCAASSTDYIANCPTDQKNATVEPETNQSNYVSPDQTTAASSNAAETSGFWGFLKHWYLWILVILVLIFLFIIVFRRLSSNV